MVIENIRAMKNSNDENLNLHSSNIVRVLLLLGIMFCCLWFTFGAVLY